MSALSIQPTYPIFTDIDGQPLEAGYVWIGTANLDPQTNPINVYWDAALTILAPQPIRTLAGYPSRNGTPARLYVNSDYSIRVMNRNGSVVYSAPAATERYSDIVISGVNAEEVIYDPPFTGGVQTNVEAKLAQTVSVKDFGAAGDGIANDAAACVLANNASSDVTFPAGNYYIGTSITLTSSLTMQAGAKFIVASGITLTINGAVYAGSRQYIFDGDSGSVTGTFGYVALWVDWFGAAPDSSISATPTGTDSGIGINKAIVAANNGTTRFGNVKFNSGVYLIETPVVSSVAGVVIEGAGKYNTHLICKTTFTGTVVTIGGSGGPPSVFRGFGVDAAVGGAFSAVGIDAKTNGTFISDIWVTGFGLGVKLDSTDQFMFDFAVELCVSGILCSSSNINVSNGTVYGNQAAGIIVDNSAALEPGAITISNVRSTTDTQVGFLLTNAKNVILDACSASHINATSYTVAAFKVDGNSTAIQFNGCVAKLGAQSGSSIGFLLNGLGEYTLNNCISVNFNKGISVATTGVGVVNINGGIYTAKLHGIHATAYNFLNINNTQCNYTGQTGASDTGIRIEASQAFQRALIDGNLCGASGGGTQDYGIYVTCTNATSYGLVTSNVTPFNNVAGLLIDGANAANFTSANNIN